jgi:hypothetical protein
MASWFRALHRIMNQDLNIVSYCNDTILDQELKAAWLADQERRRLPMEELTVRQAPAWDTFGSAATDCPVRGSAGVMC